MTLHVPTAGGRPLRSFIAIELADEARAAVEAYLAPLRTAPGVVWPRGENLHLTLKFLGDVVPERLAALAARLEGVARAQAPFALTLAGVGAFPSWQRPRVLWIGVVAPALAPLAAAVEAACAAERFPPETRPFHPHLTLGRVRDAGDGGRGRTRRRDRGRRASDAPAGVAAVIALLERDGGREFGSSPARELVLFRSELGPGGSRYTALARFPFSAVAGG